jgi:DNA-binding response OmpR family regulator
MRALVIEDQEECASYLVKGLTNGGYAVDWEKDGEKGSWKARFTDYDILLSDINLPGKNGIEVLKEIRKVKKNVPFIMVTVEKNIQEKLEAFRLGADDYVVKPFSVNELLARARAVLKRGEKAEGEIITIGDIALDNLNFKVFKNKKEIKLRRKEYDLLYYLMRNAGRVLPRMLLLEKVWDMNADPFTNTVDVHIRSLRKRIGDSNGKIIQTIYGRGYEFKNN